MASCHITIKANLKFGFNTGIYKNNRKKKIFKSHTTVKSAAIHFKLQRGKQKVSSKENAQSALKFLIPDLETVLVENFGDVPLLNIGKALFNLTLQKKNELVHFSAVATILFSQR